MTEFSNSDPELTSNRSGHLPNRLPPIRILDLMVLTASMAFVYMLQGQLTTFQPELNSTAWNIMGLIASVPSGIALAAVYWVVIQKRLTGKLLLQPGHWILASQAVLMLQTIVVVLLVTSVGGNSISEFFQTGAWVTASLVSFGLINLLASLVLFRGLMFDAIRWRFVLGATAFTYLADALIYVSQSFLVQNWFTSVVTLGSQLKFGASTFCILFLVVAAMIDIRTRTRRDWLHWAGVAVLFFASAVVPLAQLIYVQFFFAPA